MISWYCVFNLIIKVIQIIPFDLFLTCLWSYKQFNIFTSNLFLCRWQWFHFFCDRKINFIWKINIRLWWHNRSSIFFIGFNNSPWHFKCWNNFIFLKNSLRFCSIVLFSFHSIFFLFNFWCLCYWYFTFTYLLMCCIYSCL